MSLTEILIALVLLGIIFIPVAGYMGIGAQTLDYSASLLQADNLIEKAIAKAVYDGTVESYTVGRYYIESQMVGDFVKVRVTWGDGPANKEKIIYGFKPNNSY